MNTVQQNLLFLPSPSTLFLRFLPSMEAPNHHYHHHRPMAAFRPPHRAYDLNPTMPPPPFPPPHSSSSSPSSLYLPPHPPGVDPPASYLPPYDLHYVHPSPATSALHFTPEQQRINTLFISGLPDDVKAREIHNLFRRRHGFESCQLKYTGRGDQVVSFATFFDHRSAVMAMTELNGTIFDPHTGATLNVELARSNSRTKRPRGNRAYTIIDKRVKVAKDGEETSSNDGDGRSDEQSNSDNDNSSNKGDLHAIQSDDTAANVDRLPAKHEKNEKPLAAELPPCSTLFIANLGPNCTEEELKQAMSQCSGFQTLKMRGRGGMPVAFADFKDVECSTYAMNSLQGELLPSSDRGGMHLEYARSKMRRV